MEITNSDKIYWPNLFSENEFIAINYQPKTDCKGCKEMNDLFEKMAQMEDFKKVKFLWVDSRNNPIAELFPKK